MGSRTGPDHPMPALSRQQSRGLPSRSHAGGLGSEQWAFRLPGHRAPRLKTRPGSLLSPPLPGMGRTGGDPGCCYLATGQKRRRAFVGFTCFKNVTSWRWAKFSNWFPRLSITKPASNWSPQLTEEVLKKEKSPSLPSPLGCQSMHNQHNLR